MFCKEDRNFFLELFCCVVRIGIQRERYLWSLFSGDSDLLINLRTFNDGVAGK